MLEVNVRTICVHGDTPGAATVVEKLRAGFAHAGITVYPLGQTVV